MKRIIIGLAILVLAITSISIGLIYSQNQSQTPTPSLLPKDLGKLEYKFNKDEVVVYGMEYKGKNFSDLIKESDKEINEQFVVIQKIIGKNESGFDILTALSKKEGQNYSKSAHIDYTMDKEGSINSVCRDDWFHLNQPVFPKEVTQKWEKDLTLNLGMNRPEDPQLDLKAKYLIRETVKLGNIDCLIIESEISGKKDIPDYGYVEVNDKAITYFGYKEGRVLKIDLDHNYKVSDSKNGKEIIIRNEEAHIIYNLSKEAISEDSLKNILE